MENTLAQIMTEVVKNTRDVEVMAIHEQSRIFASKNSIDRNLMRYGNLMRYTTNSCDIRKTHAMYERGMRRSIRKTKNEERYTKSTQITKESEDLNLS